MMHNTWKQFHYMVTEDIKHLFVNEENLTTSHPLVSY